MERGMPETLQQTHPLHFARCLKKVFTDLLPHNYFKSKNYEKFKGVKVTSFY